MYVYSILIMLSILKNYVSSKFYYSDYTDLLTDANYQNDVRQYVVD